MNELYPINQSHQFTSDTTKMNNSLWEGVVPQGKAPAPQLTWPKSKSVATK